MISKKWMLLITGGVGALVQTNCSAFHRCMCGHLAHADQYRTLAIIVDYIGVAFLGAVLVLAVFWIEDNSYRRLIILYFFLGELSLYLSFPVSAFPLFILH